jgi:hypothetical protein
MPPTVVQEANPRRSTTKTSLIVDLLPIPLAAVDKAEPLRRSMSLLLTPTLFSETGLLLVSFAKYKWQKRRSHRGNRKNEIKMGRECNARRSAPLVDQR